MKRAHAIPATGGDEFDALTWWCHFLHWNGSGQIQRNVAAIARIAKEAGVDISVIALWLGHESPVTTHGYVEADLTMKERALARLHEPDAKIQRYRAPDSLIDFLNAL